MKATVDKSICIGCGACTAIAEGIFEIDNDGLAQCVVSKIPEDEEENAIEARESCPVSAIDVSK